jgi:hypothetical protein
MKQNILFVLVVIAFAACGKVKQEAKEVINKGGETVGKGATEFVEGIGEGVDKTLECNLVLSDALKAQGLGHGKFSVENSDSGHHDKFVLYLIFEKDFQAELNMKAFDKAGLEEGRTKLKVAGKAGEARFFDFVFDRRTSIDFRSKITLE